jgi:hypothetical protein
MEPAVAPDGAQQRQNASEIVQAPLQHDLEVVESHRVESPVVNIEMGQEPMGMLSPSTQSPAPAIESPDEPAFEYEEYDTLKLLQQLGGE